MSESQGGITETVQEQASQAREKGMETVSEQLDRRTTDAGKQAKTLADALRRTGRQMEAEGSGSGMTRMTSAVADRVERAGGYLERASGNEMLDDVERFARERPWVVAGAAAMAGLASARIMRSSIAGSEEAGPSVATIFVLRSIGEGRSYRVRGRCATVSRGCYCECTRTRGSALSQVVRLAMRRS